MRWIQRKPAHARERKQQSASQATLFPEEPIFITEWIMLSLADKAAHKERYCDWHLVTGQSLDQVEDCIAVFGTEFLETVSNCVKIQRVVFVHVIVKLKKLL